MALPSIHEMFPAHLMNRDSSSCSIAGCDCSSPSSSHPHSHPRRTSSHGVKATTSSSPSIAPFSSISNTPAHFSESAISKPNTKHESNGNTADAHPYSFDVLRSDPTSGSLKHLASSASVPPKGGIPIEGERAGSANPRHGHGATFRVSVPPVDHPHHDQRYHARSNSPSPRSFRQERAPRALSPSNTARRSDPFPGKPSSFRAGPASAPASPNTRLKAHLGQQGYPAHAYSYSSKPPFSHPRPARRHSAMDYPPPPPPPPSMSQHSDEDELEGDGDEEDGMDVDADDAGTGQDGTDSGTGATDGMGLISGGTTGKKHVCPTCFKRFNRPSSLKIHVNTHTGATPFRCPWPNCGREFNVNSNMRRHYRNHTTPGLSRSQQAQGQTQTPLGPPPPSAGQQSQHQTHHTHAPPSIHIQPEVDDRRKKRRVRDHADDDYMHHPGPHGPYGYDPRQDAYAHYNQRHRYPPSDEYPPPHYHPAYPPPPHHAERSDRDYHHHGHGRAPPPPPPGYRDSHGHVHRRLTDHRVVTSPQMSQSSLSDNEAAAEEFDSEERRYHARSRHYPHPRSRSYSHSRLSKESPLDRGYEDGTMGYPRPHPHEYPYPYPHYPHPYPDPYHDGYAYPYPEYEPHHRPSRPSSRHTYPAHPHPYAPYDSDPRIRHHRLRSSSPSSRRPSLSPSMSVNPASALSPKGKVPSSGSSTGTLLRPLTPGSSFHSSSPSPSTTNSVSPSVSPPPVSGPVHTESRSTKTKEAEMKARPKAQNKAKYSASSPYLESLADSRVSTTLRPAFT